jgi:hypothetical protein
MKQITLSRGSKARAEQVAQFVSKGTGFPPYSWGGYVPEKSQTVNNKTGILGPN